LAFAAGNPESLFSAGAARDKLSGKE